MKVTLRKANALQAAINESLGQLDLTTEVRVNEFEVPADKIANATARLFENMETRGKLLDALYEIRKSVSTANHVSGVNDLLVEAARVDKDQAFNARLAKVEPMLDTDVILGKQAKMKARTEDYYGREDAIISGVLDATTVKVFKDAQLDLKKKKVEIQDALLELNVRTEIDLSDQTVSTLKTAKIL